MQATSIAKWGNSLALRLPRHIAEGAGLTEGTPVRLFIDGTNLVVSQDRPRYRLADLLKGLAPKQRQKETDWGRARGKEAW
jgi:antitoxin MazE